MPVGATTSLLRLWQLGVDEQGVQLVQRIANVLGFHLDSGEVLEHRVVLVLHADLHREAYDECLSHR